MKKLLIITSLFIISFTCTLLASELYLQLSEIELAYHELDSNVGKKIQENARIIMFKEGFYLGKSNEFGYLGPSYPKGKKDNIFRIALMGDSFTEGFQLFERYHFSRILEEQLNKKSEKEVQVLNFGVGGFDLSDMYIYYLNYASAFNPDLVLYIVRPNDIVIQQKIVPAPYLYLNNDKLEINYDFRHKYRYNMYRKYKFLFDKSSYLKMLNNIYFMANKGLLPQIILDKLYNYLYVPIEHSPEENNANRDRIENKRIAFRFAQSKTTHKLIDNLGKNGNVYFLYRADFPDSVNNYIVNVGIKTLNLDPPLKELREKGIDPIYWKASRTRGHWNHQAHRAIGNYLAEKIGSSIEQTGNE